MINKEGILKSRRRIVKPHTVILHHTAGSTVSGAQSALKSRGLAYHYIIDKEGVIHKYVDPNRRCSHAYRANTGTVGVSFVCGGKYGPVNGEQLKALFDLYVQEIRPRCPRMKYLTGHKHIDPRGWKIDPRFAGEPSSGVNWDIDHNHMKYIEKITGLEFRDRHYYRK